MAVIQTAQTVEKLRRQYRLRAPYGVFLAEDLIPVTVVDDLSGASVADEGYPRNAMGRVFSGAGGAGTNAQCACVGLAGVGKVYNIYRVLIQKGTAGIVQLRFGQDVSALTIATSKGFQDVRVSSEVPDLVIGENTPIAAAPDGTLFSEVLFTGLGTIELSPDIVLGEGGFFLCRSATDNENLTVSFWWTEYLLADR